MNIHEFIRNCLFYQVEFELKWFEQFAQDDYCVHIFLSNEEYFVATRDEYNLEKLWNYLHKYLHG